MAVKKKGSSAALGPHGRREGESDARMHTRQALRRKRAIEENDLSAPEEIPGMRAAYNRELDEERETHGRKASEAQRKANWRRDPKKKPKLPKSAKEALSAAIDDL
jgi:hypothetical protein